jgi:Carboxypeptidase regulatory-like domain/TonB dependent receptor
MFSISINDKRFLVSTLSIILVCIGLFADVNYAQVTAGAIKGSVSDASGAFVPNVEVQATNLATNEQFKTITNEDGRYTLGNVPVGNYQVAAEKAGFKRLVRQPVKVTTATATNLDFTLEVGELSEEIRVEASAAPLIQTDNAELSTSMELPMLSDLPLKVGAASQLAGSGRRQIDSFIFLTPGITGTGWSTNVLGAPAHTLQAIVDGVPFTLQESPGLVERVSPPFHAVEEFKVSTTMYSADQGRGFGIGNYTIKSGTNAFHGEALWLFRNDKTDARGFFNAERPIIRQNEGGFGIGGPVIKDRTFFFGSATIYRRRGGATQRGLITIPSLAFRTGDFSALRDPTTGAQIPIFDPGTTRSDGSGGFVRDPFQNNVIPSGRISPIAKKMMDLLPPPDHPGIVNNFISRAARPVNDDAYAWKVDHSFNPSHRLSVSGWWGFLGETRFSDWGDDPVGTGNKTDFNGGGVRANWDWVISPTLLNHFGWGYNGYFKDDRRYNTELSNEDLGIKGIPLDSAGLPSFNPAGYTQTGDSSSAGETTDESSLVFTDTFSYLRGKHHFKFGGEFWRQRFTRFDQRSSAGLLDFTAPSTSQPNSPSFGVWGDSIASLLLGQVFSGTLLRNPVPNGFDTRYLALFVDDKFQVNSRLTLSLGLRYDLPWPLYSYNDIFSLVSLSTPNPAADGRPGAYAFGNAAREFGPRFALAYKLDDRTVVRSGFGIIYAQTNAQTNAHEIFGNHYQTGYSAVSQPQSLDQGVTPAFNLDDGFPPFTGTLPNLDPGIEVGGIADYISPDSGRSAYTSNWNLNIQRELPGKFFVDVGYVGTKGTRLPSNLEEINQVPAQFLSLGGILQASIDSPEAIAAGFRPPFPGFSGSVSQSLRPFPQYTDLVVHINPIGNHTYHALQMKVQRRFSGGLGVLASYTLSKIISDTSGNSWSGIENRSLDTANRGLEKSVAPIDRTHNLITNWIYELPLGRGAKGIAGKLLGGWGTGVTTTFTSGAPLAIAGGAPLPIFNGFGNRPSRVAGVARRTSVSPGEFDPARDLYLNIAAFRQPAPFTFGDVSRVEPDLRGFSLWNEDVAIIKRTFIPSISEQFNVEFRAEFFNIFNRTVFDDPAADINNQPAFGKVSGQRNEPRNLQFMLSINF